MDSSKTSKGSKPEIADGFIIGWTEAGLPEIQARRMIRLDSIHFNSTRGEEIGVYTLAEDFFFHELPARIRLKELLEAQRFYHQNVFNAIEEQLSQVVLMIEQARKEGR